MIISLMSLCLFFGTVKCLFSSITMSDSSQQKSIIVKLYLKKKTDLPKINGSTMVITLILQTNIPYRAIMHDNIPTESIFSVRFNNHVESKEPKHYLK